MSHSFDIFKIESGGRVRWQATQESFLTAQKHVQRIILSCPGQYLILDHITGDMVVVEKRGVSAQVASSGVESGDAAQFGLD